MVGFAGHGDAVALPLADTSDGYLLPDPLLHGKALGKEADKSCQFRDANDVLMGNVGDPGATVKGKRMMFAESVEVDRPLDDLAELAIRSAPALGLEHSQQL